MVKIITTDVQREWLEGWAEKWMARGILTPFIENVAGELNYITFEIGRYNVFYCILSCSGISEVSDDQKEEIANQIKSKMDDCEGELSEIGIDNSKITDINIQITTG